MLIFYTILAAFFAAWFAMYLKTCFLYYGIFGKFKFWIVSRYFDSDDWGLYEATMANEITAYEINDEIENIYAYVSRKSKITYLLGCEYCLATWILILSFIYLAFSNDASMFEYLISLPVGFSFIQFFLNFAK